MTKMTQQIYNILLTIFQINNFNSFILYIFNIFFIDPSAWSANQVHAWLRSTLRQFNLPIIDDIECKFNENGAELLQLSVDEFMKRIPEVSLTFNKNFF